MHFLAASIVHPLPGVNVMGCDSTRGWEISIILLVTPFLQRLWKLTLCRERTWACWALHCPSELAIFPSHASWCFNSIHRRAVCVFCQRGFAKKGRWMNKWPCTVCFQNTPYRFPLAGSAMWSALVVLATDENVDYLPKFSSCIYPSVHSLIAILIAIFILSFVAIAMSLIPYKDFTTWFHSKPCNFWLPMLNATHQPWVLLGQHWSVIKYRWWNCSALQV